MIELNNKMSHAEMVAWFDDAQKKIDDLLQKAKAREATKKIKKTRKAK